jgi:hypothetical protein
METGKQNDVINLKLFLSSKKVDIYPITILKYLLNEQKIKFCLNLIEDKIFKGQLYPLEKENCSFCKNNKTGTCRQHTSIDRILNIGKNVVLKDASTGIFFYKNEIFKWIEDYLVIIYCPHTKLIDGKLSKEKIKKIYPITIQNKENILKDMKIIDVDLNNLFNQSVECWLNDEFTIKLIPKQYSRQMDIILTLNK